ncbi:MAG TPA: beta-propeller domain-containing protein, partial [Microthrixaceae bacterium]|nr:beta-propeller domain-containing protein [Microthrixaceae bacterium]
ATHTGSGVAPGRLLNQFSLSEREGALRVVTTVDGGPTGMSGRLTVLDTEGDTLDAIGHLDGLGPGEEVKSVRFVGDLGYVVTFRTTDPLYALDLSDARNPRLLGELKIPGFSQYLHPVGDGLLLGVGRDADPRTGMTTGLKVSLFDVRDPAAMAELDQLVLPGASSPVGDDHRAFLWDAGRDQAVVPVDLGGGSGPALVLRVSGRRLERVAELRHGDAVGVTPLRAFVVDGDLWTLSRLGLGRTPADAPGAIDHIGF